MRGERFSHRLLRGEQSVDGEDDVGCVTIDDPLERVCDGFGGHDEVHVARVGASGPACVDAARDARRQTPGEWRDGGWRADRAFGPELVSAIGNGATHWNQLILVYVLPGLTGAALAAFAYDFMTKPRRVETPLRRLVARFRATRAA